MRNREDDQEQCHFCGQTTADGIKILKGPVGANICSNCAKQAVKMLSKASPKSRSTAKPIGRIPTPAEIVEKLDQYVIGQEDAKKTLAVAVYNHYCRLAAKDGYDSEGNRLSRDELKDLENVEIEKSNVLMIGPTGCGKTLLAKTIAKMLNVPFAIADATTLTEAGYVGEDVENIVRYAYNNAGKDVERTKRAIIWVDECDKLASKTQNVSITRDVSGEGVQQALLKIVEGTICRFPPNGGRKHPDQELVEIDTSDILFICGGAFVGLDKIVKQRIGDDDYHHQIGFATKDEQDHQVKSKKDAKVRPEDLVKFGLIPELVGRLPVVTEMRELTEDELMRVLTEPKNALIKQYQKLLRLSNVRVEFDEASIRKMARLAIERKTGARGLKAEMENLMRDVLFRITDKRKVGEVVRITEDMFKEVA